MFEVFNQYEEQLDKEFENYSELNDYNKRILGYAIAYHDAFYLPGFIGNEHISAQIADYDLHVELSTIERNIVYDLIESTNYRFPFPSNPTPNKMILHDLDWYGFAHYDELLYNEVLIYNENKAPDRFFDKDAIEKQKLFYKRVIDRNIFKTQTFAVYNDIARENIKKRLNELNKNDKINQED